MTVSATQTTTWPSVGDSRLIPAGHSSRIIDAVLMGLIVVRTEMPGLPVSVPVAQVALIVLLGFAVFRRPARSLERVRWYPLAATLMLVFLAIVSLMQDADFIRRLGNIAVLMTVAGFMASGRIDVGSAIKGIGVALLVNLALFYTGVAPDTYGGVLTGYLADKNAAGLVYGVGAILLTLTIKRISLRVLVLIGGALALLLTDSRTAMAAFAAACVWILVAPLLGIAFRVALGAGLVIAYFWADLNLADFGVYGQTRAGSDALRERIDAAAAAKVADTPWFGGGLGEASVWVDDLFWYFHNAYQGLLAEGGVVALVVVVAMYVVTGFRVFAPTARSFANTVVSAATLFLLLVATRLGEVFLAPVGFVLLGTGLALIVEHDPFSLRSGAKTVSA